jgi:hypothetical protein
LLDAATSSSTKGTVVLSGIENSDSPSPSANSRSPGGQIVPVPSIRAAQVADNGAAPEKQRRKFAGPQSSGLLLYFLSIIYSDGCFDEPRRPANEADEASSLTTKPEFSRDQEASGPAKPQSIKGRSRYFDPSCFSALGLLIYVESA